MGRRPLLMLRLLEREGEDLVALLSAIVSLLSCLSLAIFPLICKLVQDSVFKTVIDEVSLVCSIKGTVSVDIITM